MTTLNYFLETQKDSPEWANTVTKSGGAAKAKQVVDKKFGVVKVPQWVYEEMILKLCEALDLEFGELLVNGFKKQQEILSYKGKKGSPDKPITLYEHTFESKHAPEIVIHATISGKKIEIPLKFDVSLKLKFSGGDLYITDGKITRIEMGSVKGTGTIEYEGHTVLKRETASYNLHFKHTFKPPIEI
jgi:hypothetical protein